MNSILNQATLVVGKNYKPKELDELKMRVDKVKDCVASYNSTLDEGYRQRLNHMLNTFEKTKGLLVNDILQIIQIANVKGDSGTLYRRVLEIFITKLGERDAVHLGPNPLLLAGLAYIIQKAPVDRGTASVRYLNGTYFGSIISALDKTTDKIWPDDRRNQYAALKAIESCFTAMSMYGIDGVPKSQKESLYKRIKKTIEDAQEKGWAECVVAGKVAREALSRVGSDQSNAEKALLVTSEVSQAAIDFAIAGGMIVLSIPTYGLSAPAAAPSIISGIAHLGKAGKQINDDIKIQRNWYNSMMSKVAYLRTHALGAISVNKASQRMAYLKDLDILLESCGIALDEKGDLVTDRMLQALQSDFEVMKARGLRKTERYTNLKSKIKDLKKQKKSADKRLSATHLAEAAGVVDCALNLLSVAISEAKGTESRIAQANAALDVSTLITEENRFSACKTVKSRTLVLLEKYFCHYKNEDGFIKEKILTGLSGLGENTQDKAVIKLRDSLTKVLTNVNSSQLALTDLLLSRGERIVALCKYLHQVSPAAVGRHIVDWLTVQRDALTVVPSGCFALASKAWNKIKSLRNNQVTMKKAGLGLIENALAQLAGSRPLTLGDGESPPLGTRDYHAIALRAEQAQTGKTAAPASQAQYGALFAANSPVSATGQAPSLTV